MNATVSLIAALILAAIDSPAQDQRQIVDLRGTWKFEIGDKQSYADPKYDDSKWEDIFVPEVWENEGYPGYDGYAWYRKKFSLKISEQNKNLFFHGGFIDDASRVYVNGHLIGGKGLFPPEFETAYDTEVIAAIPKEYLRYNQENVVAIRVYDDYRYGGITRGKVGIFEHTSEINFAVRFPDLWKFKTGDDERWSAADFDDSKWQQLIVPTPWDIQGYQEYDGFAWYRVSFDVPSNVQNEKLYVLLGKIDDIDEAYINGVKIGNTGKMEGSRWVQKITEEYQELRVYRIPSTALRSNQKNTLALRVYDKMKYGGVCEGPVGIITEKEHRRLNLDDEIRNRYDRNKFERFLDKIFNE